MTDQAPPAVLDEETPDVPSDPAGSGAGSAYNATIRVEENN